MNKERIETELSQIVSDTYRELGEENAPEHLNQAILRRANAGSSSRIQFGAWMKPLAWTAVIALSLAVVLEVTQTTSYSPPVVQQDEIVQPAATPAHKADAQPASNGAGRSFSKIQPAEQTDARERAKSIAIPMSKKASAAGCDAATRASREDWMECIQDLRDTGFAEQADLEYEAFLVEYPPQ